VTCARITVTGIAEEGDYPVTHAEGIYGKPGVFARSADSDADVETRSKPRQRRYQTLAT
jgi:hypothetical protein